MREVKWLGRVIAVAASAALAVLVETAVVAAPTVKGDLSVYNDAVAAYRRLFALPGFRMKISFPDGRAINQTWAPPNFSFTLTTPQGYTEIYQVGGVYEVQQGGQCRKIAKGPSLPKFDLTAYKGEVTVGRKPDTSIDGTPVHNYTYVMVSPGGSESRGDLYIGARTGLPRRVVNAAGGKKTEGEQPNTIDYYDYGASITIALPC